MPLDYADALARSRPGRAFSNGFEGDNWTANWCDRCLRDAPFRTMGKGSGCPLLLIAMLGDRTPAEWMEQPWGQVQGAPEGVTAPPLGDRYHCIEFRAPGAGGGEPKPVPAPPDQGALFDRPPTRPRMLTPLPEDHPEPVAVHDA